MCSPHDTSALLRLRVVADADPGAIARVLERFHNLNVIPRRVAAEFAIDGAMHMEVDVLGLSESQMEFIAAKVRQSISVTSAYWHPM